MNRLRVRLQDQTLKRFFSTRIKLIPFRCILPSVNENQNTMKRKNVLLLMTAFLAIGLMFSGCKKDKSLVSEDQTTPANDFALIENIFDDVNAIADEAAMGNTGLLKSTDDSSYGIMSPCATVTRDTTVFPRTITIDFGTTNCLCHDGNYRRGKIMVSHTDRYFVPGSVKTITFDNYFENDNQVLGTKTITNNGRNEANNLSWTKVVDGTIIFATGETKHWTANSTREWIEGDGSLIRIDDVFLLTGLSTITRISGETFTHTILTPLRKEMSCHNIVSGIVEITSPEKPTRTLDYGTGECDNLATVTVNGETHTIILRH